MANTILPPSVGISWGDAVPAVDTFSNDLPVSGSVEPQAPAPAPTIGDKPGELLAASAAAKQNLNEVSDAKKFLLQDAMGLRKSIIAAQEGVYASEVEKDAATLSPLEFMNKYPETGTDIGGYYAIRDRFNAGDADTRSTSQVVQDTGVAVAGGVAQGLGGLATVGASFIDPALGVKAADLNNQAQDWFSSKKTNEYKGIAERGAVRDQVETEQNAREYQAELDSGADPTIAGLKRIGKDFIDVTGNLLNDPARALDATASGIGNVIGSVGVTGRILKVAGIAAESSLAKNIYAAVSTVSEGGDAYSSAVQVVMNTPLDQLMEQSPEFASLVQQGMSPEDARAQIADNAGKVAFAIQAPASFLGERALAGFEMRPFAGVARGVGATVKDTLSYIGKEYLQEGIQEGSSQWAANYGVQTEALPKQDLTDGVGEQSAVGAIAGAGMAGGPRLAAGVAALPMDTARAIYEGVKKNLSQKEQAKAEASIKDLRDEQDANEDLKSDAIINETGVVAINNSPYMTESLKAKFEQNNKSQVQNLLDLYTEAYRGNLSDSDTENLILMADSFVKNMGDPDNRENVKASLQGRTKEDIIKVMSFWQKAMENPHFQKLTQVVTDKALGNAPLVTEENVSDPEVNAKATSLLNMAQFDPAKADKTKLKAAIDQAKAGNIKVTPEVLSAAESIFDMHDAIDTNAEMKQAARDEIGSKQPVPNIDLEAEQKGPTQEQVKENIQSGKSSKFGSLALYAKRFAAAAQKSGNGTKARDAIMSDLHDFAQTQINKLNAMQKSHDDGTGTAVPYRAKSYKGWMEIGDKISAKPLTFHQGDERSYLLAKDIEADTTQVVEYYNKMAARFGKPLMKMPTSNFVFEDKNQKPAERFILPVLSPNRAQHVKKDQAKADKANKFIGRGGTDKSSTEAYRKAWGARANMGSYKDTDVVMLSAEGRRSGRIDPDFAEIQKAMDAGATLLTDTPEARNTHYNLGEQQIAAYLEKNGYKEVTPGEWKPANKEKKLPPKVDYNISKEEAEQAAKEYEAEQAAEKAKAEANAKNEYKPRKGTVVKVQPKAGPTKPLYNGEERPDKPKRPSKLRPISLKNFVRRYGIDRNDPNAQEILDMEYNAPGFIRNDNIKNSKTGGYYVDDVLSSAIQAGYLPKGSTIRDFVDALDQDIRSRDAAVTGVYAQEDLYAVQDWAAYDAAMAEYERFNSKHPTKPRLKLIEDNQDGNNSSGNSNSSSSSSSSQGNSDNSQSGNSSGSETTSPTTSILNRKPIEKIEEITKDLVGDRFGKAYKLSPNAFFLGIDNAVQALFNLFSKNREAAVKSNFDRALMGEEQFNAYQRLMVMTNNILKKGLNDRLYSEKVSFSKQQNKMLSVGEALEEGKDIAGFQQTRIASLLVRNEEGKYRYHDRILNAAILGVVQWIIDTDHKIDKAEPEDILAALGFDKNSDITLNGNMREAYYHGSSETRSAENLAKYLMKFIGITENKDTSRSDTQGIIGNLAVEIMEVLEKNDKLNMIEHTHFKSGLQDENKWQYNAIRFHPAVEGYRRALLRVPNILTDMADIEREVDEPIFGEAPTEVAKTQHGNSDTENTAEQKQMIAAAQKIPKFINMPFFDFMNAVGKERYLKFLGHDPEVDNKELPYNVNHAKSVRGLNNSLEQGWDKSQTYFEKAKAYAEAFKMELKDVPIFNKFNVVVTGRLMELGFGGQANKTAREAMSPTRAMLDITKYGDHDTFWITMAQALGIKTHKMFWSGAITKAKALTEEAPFVALVQAIKAKDAKAIQEAMDNFDIWAENKELDKTDKLLHAVVSKANYEVAEKNGTLLEHFLALEADGVTDGPINAMIAFAIKWSSDLIMKLRMGGLFIGDKDMSMNKAWANEANEQKDLYQYTSTDMTRIMTGFSENIPDDQRPIFNATMNAISGIGSVTFKNGIVEVLRNMMKNPLTITVYGSRANGIAGKVMYEFEDALYKSLTEFQIAKTKEPDLTFEQFNPAMRNAIASMNTVVMQEIRYRKDVNGNLVPFIFTHHDNKIDWSDLNKFTFTTEQRKVLKSNIKRMFVDQMVQAISGSMGDTLENMQTFVKAGTAVSALLYESYNYEYNKLLAEKIKNGELKENELLSRNDEQQIIDNVNRYGAVIETGAQSFNINVSENQRDGDRTVTRSLTGRLRLPLVRRMLSGPSVKIAPFFVIGTGDGLMIQKMFMRFGKEIARILPVYDGVEMAADKIKEYSALINNSVSDMWTAKNADAVARMVSTVLASETIYEHDKAARKRIIKQLRLVDEEAERAKLNPLMNVTDTLEDEQKEIEMLRSYFGRLKADLDAFTQGNNEIKDSLRKATFSSDKMASGDNPHVNEGADVSGSNFDEVSDKMNALVEAKREAVNREEKILKPAEIEKHTYLLEKTNIRQTNWKGMINLMKAMKFSPDQFSLFRGAYNALKGQDFKFLFGSAQDLTAHRNKKFPEHTNAGAIEKAQIDIANKRMYIAEASPTAMLHEMVHLATADAVNTVINGGSVNEETDAAVRRVESLMEEFRQTYIAAWTTGKEAVAAGNVMDIINRLIHKGQRADAVNEFIAYGLTLQSFSNVLKGNKTVSLLSKVTKATIYAVRKILKIQHPNNNMFEHLRFNTQIIMNNSEMAGLVSKPTNLLNMNNVEDEEDSRLNTVVKGFTDNIRQYADQRLFALKANKLEIKNHDTMEAKATAAETVANIVHIGFKLNAEQTEAFRIIQLAMASAMKMNSHSVLRMDDLYRQALKTLTEKDFIDQDPQHPEIGISKYNYLIKGVNSLKDSFGRENTFASFIGLAMVDPEFRKLLDKVKLPVRDKQPALTFNDYVTDKFHELSEKLNQIMYSGFNPNNTVKEAMDELAIKLVKNESNIARLYEDNVANRISMASRAFADWNMRETDKFVDKLNAAIPNAPQKLQPVLKATSVLASFGSKTKSEAILAGLTEKLNEMRGNWVTPFRELLGEIRGQTNENSKLITLLNQVKQQVSAVRQAFREDIPNILAKQFTRKLTKEEWTSMYRGFGKIDPAALMSEAIDIKRLYTDEDYFNERYDYLVAKRFSKEKRDDIKATARFLMTGELTTRRLKKNAHMFSGELALNDLAISLEMMKYVSKEDKAAVAKLFEKEAKGMDFVLKYYKSLHDAEMKKMEGNNAALYNHYKGRISHLLDGDKTITVAYDKGSEYLENLSYKRIADYNGDDTEIKGSRRGYYMSPVSGSTSFNQGVMQTVQHTAFGVDPRVGFTAKGNTYGVIGYEDAMEILNEQQVAQAPLHNLEPGEYLMPVYGEKGDIVFFERHMSPEYTNMIEKNEHFGQMLGAWRGRQEEEILSDTYNEQLMDVLYSDYATASEGQRQSQFVNILESKDPIHVTTVKLMPSNIRYYAENKFGEGKLYVRIGDFNNAMGYRSASIGDAFTGNSNMHKQFLKTTEQIAKAVFGDNAYAYLVNAERTIQSAVAYAKTTIAIRSGVVILSNLVSNTKQMMIRSVPITKIATGIPAKTKEINRYINNTARRVELEAKIAATSDQFEINAMNAEIKHLENINKRLSIYPLIEAGEFSSISDGEVEVETAISANKFGDWLEDKINSLPDNIRTMGNYALVTRSTALFKGLNRAMQYGDFIFKAVYYDDLVNRRGMTKEEAVRQVSDEFVNYNYLPGRTRGYLESMGMTWFMSYKLRSIKTALNMLHRNPLEAFLNSFMPSQLPMVGSVGTPLTDNLLGKIWKGTLGYSIGPSMITNAITSNPWVALLS